MEEKKIKMSLGTAVCLFIIFVLIIALICMYYYGIYKKQNNKNEVLNNTFNEIANEASNEVISTKNEIKTIKITHTLNSEIQNRLEGDKSQFCIDNIEKSEDGYLITAYLLEEDSRVISKKEYNSLNNGGEIVFRNLKWKKDSTSNQSDGYMIIKSGEKALAIDYNSQTGEGTLENIAGAKAGGLRDYEENPIKFLVDEDILIGGFLDEDIRYENGTVKVYIGENEIKDFESMTFEELLKRATNSTGTYQECTAVIKDGRIIAISILAD